METALNKIEYLEKQIKVVEKIKVHFEDKRNDALDRIVTEIECGDDLWINHADEYLYDVAKVDGCIQEIARLNNEKNKKEA